MIRSLLFALVLSLPLNAVAIDEVFVTEAGAIRGYDPVAYHLELKPQRGSASIVHQWNGATWHFVSEANRDRFAADPHRYAPLYGGFCAYGTARGYKVSTQPEAFAIVDGKLYLNYNGEVQRIWNKDRPGYIRTADREWQTLQHEARRAEDD